MGVVFGCVWCLSLCVLVGVGMVFVDVGGFCGCVVVGFGVCWLVVFGSYFWSVEVWLVYILNLS